jgi:hypothetical protein
MSLQKSLQKIEDRYYNEWNEDRDTVIAELSTLHNDALSRGGEAFREFSDAVQALCGGVYLPYLMWVELAEFVDSQGNRDRIYKLVQAFVDSGFEEDERAKMKPLFITYFAIEREFEVNKIMSLVVEKSHPSVQEFFRKILNFVEKNKTSVDMYIEKFKMLKDYEPNFELLRMPVSKLKEVIEANA